MAKALAVLAILAAPVVLAEEPDVAILATVHAKELRFTEVPEVKVTFTGDARNQNVRKSDRDRLPDRVEPYVTYRDIGLRLTITTTLPNIEQILDEALGTSKEDVHVQTHTTPRNDHAAHRAGSRRATANDHQRQSR